MAQNKSVLVIEDEKPLSHALELKLTKLGHSVSLASNGKDGLEKLEHGHFDVVLLDLMMPEMSGFEVLEQIKSKEITVDVYVLSNLSQHEDEEKVMALGAKKFFIKSDTPLAQIIEEIGV